MAEGTPFAQRIEYMEAQSMGINSLKELEYVRFVFRNNRGGNCGV
jgi:hypothetical protein